MMTVPFTTPALSQVTAVQTILAGVSWQMHETSTECLPFRAANDVFSGDELDWTALVKRIMGGPGYLFRYRSDPTGFARLIFRTDERLGCDFLLFGGPEPAVIALHGAEGIRVSTRIFIDLKSLTFTAPGGDYFELRDLNAEPASRMIDNILWAGSHVFPRYGAAQVGVDNDGNQRRKALAILAKSVFRELSAVGYGDKDIVNLATSLLRLVKSP